MITKTQIIKLLDSLPEEITIDHLVDHLVDVQDREKKLADLKNGRIIRMVLKEK